MSLTPTIRAILIFYLVLAGANHGNAQFSMWLMLNRSQQQRTELGGQQFAGEPENKTHQRIFLPTHELAQNVLIDTRHDEKLDYQS